MIYITQEAKDIAGELYNIFVDLYNGGNLPRTQEGFESFATEKIQKAMNQAVTKAFFDLENHMSTFCEKYQSRTVARDFAANHWRTENEHQ